METKHMKQNLNEEELEHVNGGKFSQKDADRTKYSLKLVNQTNQLLKQINEKDNLSDKE